MSKFSFKNSAFEVREDLVEAHKGAWECISTAGTWLTGKRRVAVAAETRKARERASCAEAREALSPGSVKISNTTLGVLTDAEVEVIHRVVCDPGRLSEPWSQSIIGMGLSEGEYVEIIGLISMVMILDTCSLGLGLYDLDLPEPKIGVPTQYIPPGAKKNAAWLPTVEPGDTVEEDGPMYPSPKAGYILRGLSAVPQTLRDYWAMANIHYTPGQFVYQFNRSIRAITRPQIELIAARVSALHQCAY